MQKASSVTGSVGRCGSTATSELQKDEVPLAMAASPSATAAISQKTTSGIRTAFGGGEVGKTR